MTQTQIKIITLFVVGMLIGPTYHVYCSMFAGTILTEVMSTGTQNRWVTDNGSILRVNKGVAIKPLEIFLSPDKNPVTVHLACISRNCQNQRTGTVSLYNEEIPLFRDTIAQLDFWTFHSYRSGPINAPHPARLMLWTEFPEGHESRSQWKITIKSNVTIPSLLILWVGYCLTALPVLFFSRRLRAA